VPESFTDTPLLTGRFDGALHYATRHHARQTLWASLVYLPPVFLLFTLDGPRQWLLP